MADDKKLQDNSIEDTLSTIKSIVESEAESSNDDSVIDLTETEMVSTSDKPNEELIDIKSFDETGELNQTDEKSALVAKAQHGDDDAIAEFSKSLTAENSGSTEDDLSSQAEMLESASKTYAEKTFPKTDDEDLAEEPATQATQASDEDIAAAMEKETSEKVIDQLENKVTRKVALKAVPSVSGLQVGFPIEVLAEALRPMISDWVEENLPVLVEKLVREELSKLADK